MLSEHHISRSTVSPAAGLIRLVAASVVGTAIEFYDFFLYATAAALVFNKDFFPTRDPLTGIFLAFVTYAADFWFDLSAEWCSVILATNMAGVLRSCLPLVSWEPLTVPRADRGRIRRLVR
jgi:hypothetical protein